MNRRLIVLLIVLVGLCGAWLFNRPKSSGPPAAVVETKLKCAREECGAEQVAKLAQSFEAFPVNCPQCGQKSAYLLGICPGCQARHANVGFRQGLQRCSKCGAELPPE